MPRYIPDEIIQDVRAANNIVDVISETVKLKRQGSNFTGLCPFHNEKTPSFIVSQEKQIFRCFGCGEGGNVFSFVMKRDNLSFPDTVRLLAKRVGITVPENENPRQAAETKKRKRFYEINELASNFYHYILLNHKAAEEARNYLKSRKIIPETVEGFQIGFALPAWDSLLQFMSKKGYSTEELEQAGLIISRTSGHSGYYDRFRNRIIFPIRDVSGQVTGFGGRVMDNSQPKYLNSPETSLFSKGRLLFGLNRSVDSIRKQDKVIIVEGYMDVITCHQAGVTNVVASLGTALTKDQGKLLLRYTRDVVMAYDADAAGINATQRGWQILDELGCRVRVVRIPDGKDPDEFIKNHGSENFIKVISENSLSLYDYITERAMEKYDIYSLEGKFKIASEVIPSIKNLSNEIEKDEAILKLAQKLHLSPDAIRTEVEKFDKKSRNGWIDRDKITINRDNKSTSDFHARNTEKLDARARAEKGIMAIIIEDKNKLMELNKEINLNFTEKQEYLNIIHLLNQMIEKGHDYKPSVLFDLVEDKKTLEILKTIGISDDPINEKEKLFNDCLKVIKEDELRKKREDLLQRMAEADKQRNEELRQELLMEYSKLI